MLADTAAGFAEIPSIPTQEVVDFNDPQTDVFNRTAVVLVLLNHL